MKESEKNTISMDELEEKSAHLYQALTVIGAVDVENQEAVNEIPYLIKRLSEIAAEVYLAICDRRAVDTLSELVEAE